MNRVPVLMLLSILSACATTAPPAEEVAPRPAMAEKIDSESWHVVSYFDGQRSMASPLLDAPISATFGGDGRITGHAGCNNYSAPYQLAEDSLSIGPIAATRRFCSEPPEVMQQEARYFEALQSATTLRRVGDRLQLRTAQDSLAVFLTRRPAGEPAR
jgi:heat shock protein HslJ